MHSNSTVKKDVLNSVVGYVEAVKKKAEMEKTGTDFFEERGKTQQTINTLHPKRLRLKVTDIFTDTASTKTLRVEAIEGYLPPFQAGQYINVFVDINGSPTARPYAMSSSPNERGYYDLTVKKAQGGFVSHHLVDELSIGQELLSSGPMGSFHHNPLFHGNDLVFFAGGSGIAPARSMIKHIIDKNLNQTMHIIYSNSYEDDVIFENEIRGYAEQNENIELTEIISRPSESYTGLAGRVTKDLVIEHLSDLDKKMFYICGPTPFNESCAEILKQLGVKERRMLVELNGPPKQPEAQIHWPKDVSTNKEITITIKGKGSFIAKAGEPLLNSLERYGLTTENACRSGECSLCRVKLVEGEVFNPHEAKLRKSDRKFGWIHSCVAFPMSDVEIDI
jgi:ferredoxin-NADP reductase